MTDTSDTPTDNTTLAVFVRNGDDDTEHQVGQHATAEDARAWLQEYVSEQTEHDGVTASQTGDDAWTVTFPASDTGEHPGFDVHLELRPVAPASTVDVVDNAPADDDRIERGTEL